MIVNKDWLKLENKQKMEHELFSYNVRCFQRISDIVAYFEKHVSDNTLDKDIADPMFHELLYLMEEVRIIARLGLTIPYRALYDTGKTIVAACVDNKEMAGYFSEYPLILGEDDAYMVLLKKKLNRMLNKDI